MGDLLRSTWGGIVALGLIVGALVADRLGLLERDRWETPPDPWLLPGQDVAGWSQERME